MALHFIHGVQAISHRAQMKSLEDHLILRKRSCNRSSTNMEHEPMCLSPGHVLVLAVSQLHEELVQKLSQSLHKALSTD